MVVDFRFCTFKLYNSLDSFSDSSKSPSLLVDTKSISNCDLIHSAILSISLSAYSQKIIPNISLSDFEGEKIKIFEAIDENKITVISLWATWCVPCIKELDAINEVYEDWKDELDFNLLAISVDDSRSVRRAKALVNGKSWPYEIYLDTNQDFKRALGTSFIPQTLIVKNKKILYQHTGYQPGDEDYLFEKLNTYADSN